MRSRSNENFLKGVDKNATYRYYSTNMPKKEKMSVIGAVKDREDTMKSFLNTYVKEVIEKHPEVGKILGDFNIGCVTCAEGTCLLKDIVKYHHMPEARRAELMLKIEKALFPGRDIRVPEETETAQKDASAPTVNAKKFKYSPPIKKLVDEHVLIKRFLALIPEIAEEVDLESESDRRLVMEGVDFIRSYADRFHHAKEEDTLFKLFDENEPSLRVMRDNHETGRAHARGMVEAVERRDREKLAGYLNGYRELLMEHIKKEDEILYPWMDGEMSIKQVGELYGRFLLVDQETGGETPKKHEAFVEKLEKKSKGKRCDNERTRI